MGADPGHEYRNSSTGMAGTTGLVAPVVWAVQIASAAPAVAAVVVAVV